MTPISTTEILAIRLLDRVQRKYGFNMQECYSNWACTQLENGYSSANLNILAAMTLHDNFFEVESFFLKALKDLNISIPNKSDAVRSYVILICNKIINKELSEKQGCWILAKIYQDLDYDPFYQRWYDLYESIEANFITNFAEVVGAEANQFLKRLSKNDAHTTLESD